MNYLIVIGIAVVVVGIAFFLLAIKTFTSKMITGKLEPFPETSIGGNKKLKKIGIYCPKTLDAIERKKVKDEILATSCESCSSDEKNKK